MTSEGKHRYVVNEEQAETLLDVLFQSDDPASCWVRSARFYLEGMLAAMLADREPSALKMEESGDERNDEQQQWTN